MAMQMTIDVVVVAAIISAISGGAGVLSAHALSKKQKREEVSALVRSIVLEHQATCPVGEQVRSDAARERKEVHELLESVRSELRTGMGNLTKRLDAIYARMGDRED
jgi:hypothetical protein